MVYEIKMIKKVKSESYNNGNFSRFAGKSDSLDMIFHENGKVKVEKK